jgi:SAM-dependent methyltransferase
VENILGEKMTHKKCPICGSGSTKVFLERNSVPVHQNVLFTERQQAITMPRGDLRISVCPECSFVFNAAFLPEIMSYDQSYENTQNYSFVFDEYLDGMIEYLVNEKDVKNKNIIEVGCGKGAFLRKLVEMGDNRGIGFDPSYVGPLEDLSGKLVFRLEFFDDTHKDLVSDFVICRHVIEHIENPVAMLSSIRKAVQKSEDVLVCFETPDVDWILKNEVVWDFFYEHCSYFSSQSIRVAFEKAGFKVENIKKIFGGQYLWVEARPASVNMESPVSTMGNQTLFTAAEKFGKMDRTLSEQWQNRVADLAKDGDVLLWGAGAKGVTFANLFDPQREFIKYIVDVNPNKQGKFLPGTGHHIISPAEISKKMAAPGIVILNPNYLMEIDDVLGKLQIHPRQLVEFSVRS